MEQLSKIQEDIFKIQEPDSQLYFEDDEEIATLHTQNQVCQTKVKEEQPKQASSCDILKQIIPNFSEVQRSIEVLRRATPKIFSSQNIDILYQNIICTLQENQTIPTAFQQSRASHSFLKRVKETLKLPDFERKHQLQQNHLYDQDIKMESQLQISQRIPKVSCGKIPKSSSNKKVSKPSKFMHAEMDRISNSKIQTTLLQLYREGYKFAQIKNRLSAAYPQHAQIFNSEVIRCKFNKIMRAAVRKLQNMIDMIGQYRLPKLVRLDDEMIKSVMNHSLGLPSRMMLIQVHLRKQSDLGVIQRTIETINELFRYRGD